MITGASSGIGAATAELLAADGWPVWITYAHDEQGAESTAERCRAAGSPDVVVSRLDLRSPAEIDGLAAAVEERWGGLEVLVNNGGTCPYTALADIDVAEWDSVLETNARGTFLLSRALLPALRRGSPDRSIVNISSVAGEVGGIQTSIHYAASKAAILAITKTFARHFAAEGIRANAVCPGPVESGITSNLSDSGREALTVGVPLGRFGTADEVAWVIYGLASDRAGFVTGATFDVNGGARIG